MNIEQGIDEHMKHISGPNGVCFSIEERIKLETLLDQLKSDIKCEEMMLWGKIMGVEKDYYIALALFYKGNSNFPKRKFYYCTSNTFIFSELPEVQKHHLKDFARFNTYFIGNPDIILEKYTEDRNNTAPNEPIGDTFKPKLGLKNMTEADRLSFVVRSITHDTSVVPVGGYKMLPINEIRRNDLFDGLTTDQLPSLSNYAHFRPVETMAKRDKITMGKAVFDFFFLDSLSDDPIKETWSLHVDSTKTTSCLRSLVWPGYFAYHVANTDQFGGVYVGYGIKNVDVPFMQQ